jgi:hypothetical protein
VSGDGAPVTGLPRPDAGLPAGTPRVKGDTTMPLSIPLSAFAIAIIYYSWRDGYYWRMLKDKSLRERVAYMLWTAAQHP